MSPTDRIVVPMPGASSATCEEAVEEAKREFNPIYAACDPRLPSMGSFRGPIGGLVHREYSRTRASARVQLCEGWIAFLATAAVRTAMASSRRAMMARSLKYLNMEHLGVSARPQYAPQ
jgi:hypothetical protein